MTEVYELLAEATRNEEAVADVPLIFPPSVSLRWSEKFLLWKTFSAKPGT